jgi:hypothetical protein
MSTRGRIRIFVGADIAAPTEQESRWDERRDGALMLTRTPPVCSSPTLPTNPCAIIRRVILPVDGIDYWRIEELIAYWILHR